MRFSLRASVSGGSAAAAAQASGRHAGCRGRLLVDELTVDLWSLRRLSHAGPRRHANPRTHDLICRIARSYPETFGTSLRR